MSRWIIVEDEPDLYDVLLTLTELMGVDGVAFANGEDAIAWIEDNESNQLTGELPELALLDVRLPGDTSGIDVGARLRQSALMGDITTVLMTAYRFSATDEKTAIKQAGADAIIYKPLPRLPELLRQLKAATAKRRRRNRRKHPTTPPVLPFD